MHQLNQWHPNYSVFVKELDNQHKELIDMLNELYDAYLNNLHHEKVGKIIEQMITYATVHFNAEEKYFKQFEYEDALEHIEEHRNFLKKVEVFHADFKENKTTLSLQVINFLQEWLNHHILTVDKKYVSCFQNGGLK